MLTANGKHWLKYVGNMNQSVGGTSWIMTSGSPIDYYQYTVDQVRSYMGNSGVLPTPSTEVAPGTGSQWGKWIGLGTGNTAESSSDYCLDSFTNALTYVTGVASNQNGLTNLTATFENNTSSNVVIKEIGVYLDMSGWSFMMARKVLSSPVTVAPGATKSFTARIDIDL